MLKRVVFFALVIIFLSLLLGGFLLAGIHVGGGGGIF